MSVPVDNLFPACYTMAQHRSKRKGGMDVLWYGIGMDITYVLVIAAALFSIIASIRVKSVFKKYSQVFSPSGMTGANAAELVLRSGGITDVAITATDGDLTDHYEPRNKVIALSGPVHSVCSVAAVGVAAHEAGHALQHAEAYFPLTIRNKIIPITNFGSRLAIPLVLIGLVLCRFSQNLLYIAYIGIILFSFCVLFQLLTLPTELNASRRALRVLRDSGRFSEEELGGVKTVLRAAAYTYVAATAVAFTQLIRMLSLVSRSNRR